MSKRIIIINQGKGPNNNNRSTMQAHLLTKIRRPTIQKPLKGHRFQAGCEGWSNRNTIHTCKSLNISKSSKSMVDFKPLVRKLLQRWFKFSNMDAVSICYCYYMAKNILKVQYFCKTKDMGGKSNASCLMLAGTQKKEAR